MTSPALFDIETVDNTVVVAPLHNISSLADTNIDAELSRVLDLLDQIGTGNVIVDFASVDYFGSSMLEALLHLWKRVSMTHGRMLICNVSAVSAEVLRVGRFDTLWPCYTSRAAALRAIERAEPPRAESKAEGKKAP